jgi:hypothetical protein
MMIDCCGLTNESEVIKECAGKPLYVLASQTHEDQFDPNIMKLDVENIKWLLSSDIRKKIYNIAIVRFLEKGSVYRDRLLKIEAYGSTDEGVSFYIECAHSPESMHSGEYGGMKIFHAGDLNNWHWNEEETPEDAAKNEKSFLIELQFIAHNIKPLDAAMFPVDPRLGKDYFRGAEQFLDSIKTKLFIPMHFWDKPKAANAFKPEAEKRGCRFAEIRAPGDEFEI